MHFKINSVVSVIFIFKWSGLFTYELPHADAVSEKLEAEGAVNQPVEVVITQRRMRASTF